MDFVSDALANGRRLKSLTITDGFTRECLDIVVDHGISGAYVVRVLDQIARFRGYPRAVRTDRSSRAAPSSPRRSGMASGICSSNQANPCRTATSKDSTASSAMIA